ncbi:FHA domain-containing protein [Priestia endophytica]|jgi:pSer/pThr/pTyr-binding forkhead associated (FHA) protein|uniref:FHA domain-containing protein n=2 Tax=Priestia endophytica TaxID=135735 RepID=A0AAX1Q2T0_9BACI|nr:FHA domain-containing protein [Priestia endophytica]KAB2496598.1 FHA domain-containing protein [Priestia endophytica]MCM3536382.1 FHA domain-containing protein [Priestia endophytica]RAS72515.1 hypothetical protein A3864_25995 [Priestia endophytica]RAS83820.1 hypothetical protein A4R27_05590 [Priestia endophytica]RAS86141.1 hypothetical protein A4U60_08550 [Priestia endophytica]
MDTYPKLFVECGEPFTQGAYIYVDQFEILFGRVGTNSKPDIAFSNAFVSRRHFAIQYCSGQASIVDLNSKHGTKVNGRPLTPHLPFTLKHGDIISAANETVVLHFSSLDLDQTLDFQPISHEMIQCNGTSLPFTMDEIKQTVTYKKQTCTLSDKEFLFFYKLAHSLNEFVLKTDIKKEVWPERELLEDGVPDVHAEELNALVYRMRRKLHNDFTIEVIRGKGYILHLNE